MRTRYKRDLSVPAPPRWDKLYEKYFPNNTCPESRHAVMVCEVLRNLRSTGRNALADAGYAPDHLAVSIEHTIKSLWRARAEIARLKAKKERT